MPQVFLPMKDGWKVTSGHLKRSKPTVTILPSGNSYAFALSELSDAAFVSVPQSRAMCQSSFRDYLLISRSAVAARE
jgi:hypothetical protein